MPPYRRPVSIALAALAFSGAPATARAELPPLIPREVLLGNPERTSPRISPDGKRLAWLAPDANNVLQVWVKAVGGSERLRTFTMNLLTVGFIGGMVLQVGISLLTDKATFKRGNLRKSWRKFRRSPIMQRELWNQLRDYNRRDFHPDDRDTTALVA